MQTQLLFKINAKYRDFIAIGTNAAQSTSENKKIVLVNHLILISYMNIYLFGAFYWIGNYIGIAAFAIYFVALAFATFLLKRGNIAPAKAILPIAASFVGLLINLSFPADSKFDLYNYTVMVEPFMIFTLKEYRYVIFT